MLFALLSEDLFFVVIADVKEGKLSRMRAVSVNGDVLADWVEISLSDYIRLGPGEIQYGAVIVIQLL